MQRVPIGVIGELYVGGSAVGEGYVNDSGQTSLHFVAGPFGCSQGGVLYRTENLVRFNSDGKLEYVGRNDRQVKIRGMRVEPERLNRLCDE